jgi:hypothetical protein
MAGDFVEYPDQADYDIATSIVSSSGYSTDFFIFAMGNHECYGSDYDLLRARFKSEFGLSGVYYEREVASQDFIVLGSDGYPNCWCAPISLRPSWHGLTRN